MKIDPDSIIDPKSGEVGMIKLTITPEAGFSDDINITISGLKDDMAWNQELSPVMITEQKTIIINITGLNESGEFDLRLKARSPHYTRELEIPFEVTEEDIKPDVGSDIQTYNLVIILIIIIISIFIIKLLGKFTKKSETESENETKPKQKTQKTKRKITKNKRT